VKTTIGGGLPKSGSLPKPKDTAEARAALKSEAFPAPNVQRVRMEALEFTSICPRSGQPDFGRVTIEYVPNKRCIESRSLKFYLWSFRDAPAFCESLAATIADDIARAISPRSVIVQVHQNVRGGIALVAEASR
jgi:7-cyano-7-deazaguanine reductase